MPRLLTLPALAALLALAAPAAPASAQTGTCACAGGFPLESPDLCYERPGAAIGDFAYIAPSDFLQVVGFGAGGYCRHNAAFQWTDAAGTLACEEFIGCLCANPSPGAEVLCNENDDDCDPATPDETVEVCDNDIDDDCDGNTDDADTDCDLPPTADPDTATTLEDTAVVIGLTGSDPEGDPLTFILAAGPGPPNGSVYGLTPTGPTSANVTYEPDPAYCNDGTTTDDFTFTVSDGSLTSPPATISVTVTCVIDLPTADAGTAATLEDTAVVIGLTGSEGDGFALTFIPGPDPAGGTLSGLTPTGPFSADITYTPDPDFCNDGTPTDDFTFTVDDGVATSPPATIAVTVTCVNGAP